MKLAISCDHRGNDLVKSIIVMLNEISEFTFDDKHIEVLDFSPTKDVSVDYPDYAAKVAKMVSANHAERGILVCGSGIGMSIAANKFKNVRAALVYSEETATMCRKHNDANILVLGGRVLGETLAIEIVKAWLETDFEGGRHQSRLDMFDKLENMQG